MSGKLAPNREAALHLIEWIAANECIGPTRHENGEKCVACEIYGIAHAYGGCHNGCPVKQDGKRQVKQHCKEFNAERARYAKRRKAKP